jgi:hypothetical protein
MRTLRWLSLAWLAVASAALADAPSPPPRIYRWVDQNGIAHYTTDLSRVPKELRDQPLQREEVSAQAPAIDTWVQHERVPDPPKPEPAPAASDRSSSLDAQIATLEQSIAADEALLKGDLTNQGSATSNETLEEIAKRMPERLAELKKLQAERDALATPAAQ